MKTHINNTTKPLVFLGTNAGMLKLVEVCEDYQIPIAGIIDDNYYGNTETYCEVLVIDTEKVFDDPDRLKYYKENFNFFCAVNWTPEHKDYAVRNRAKRDKFIQLIKQHNLNCISLVDRTARVSPRSTIGKNVYIDAQVIVEPSCQIGDFTTAYFNTVIGHDNMIGQNCVFQRQCMISGGNTVGDNVYFGPTVKAIQHGANYGSGTFIKAGVYIRRGTEENEVVSFKSPNQTGLLHQNIVE